jgi:ribosomal protein S12 methylthiotransferase
METQAEISAARLAHKIDRKMTVLVEEVNEEGAVARSYADAPEIDGLVYVVDGEHLQPGEFAEVVITDSDAHDLWAQVA